MSSRVVYCAPGMVDWTGRRGLVDQPPLSFAAARTCTLKVRGVMTQGDDFWGGCSMPALIAAITEAAEAGLDIVLDINSPGSDAFGMPELVAAIAAARQKVDVSARVSGCATSGAYWLACACSRIVASPVAVLGQIGAQLVMYAPSDDADIHKWQVVVTSAGSERKNASPRKDLAQYQAIVDEAARVFVQGVALGRGIPAAEVLSRFGQGGIVTAAEALRVGMIDQIDQVEGDGMDEETTAAEPTGEAEEMSLEDLKKRLEEKDILVKDLERRLAEMQAAKTAEETETKAKTTSTEARIKLLEEQAFSAKMAAAIEPLLAARRLDPKDRAAAEAAYLQSAEAANAQGVSPATKAAMEKAWATFVAALPADGVGRKSAGAPVVAPVVKAATTDRAAAFRRIDAAADELVRKSIEAGAPISKLTAMLQVEREGVL